MNGGDRIAHTSGWSTFGKTRRKMKSNMYYTILPSRVSEGMLRSPGMNIGERFRF